MRFRRKKKHDPLTMMLDVMRSFPGMEQDPALLNAESLGLFTDEDDPGIMVILLRARTMFGLPMEARGALHRDDVIEMRDKLNLFLKGELAHVDDLTGPVDSGSRASLPRSQGGYL